MNFRPVTKHDMPKIQEMNSYGFSLTPGELCIADGIIEDELTGEIISFGIIKPMAEATFLTNPAITKRARVFALSQMMDIAIERTKEFGVKQLHVFCDDSRLVKTLVKRYDFQLVTSNIILVKNL